MKILRLILFMLPLAGMGQTTWQRGQSSLTLTGRVAAFYNMRTQLDSGLVERTRDGFFLRNAQLLMEGDINRNTSVSIGIDLAQIISKANDPQAPPLLSASLEYKGLPWFDVLFGFDKVPYGRNNQVGFFQSPWWNRPEIAGGVLFSRRDVGITLRKSFWHQRIKVWLGAYNGLGEAALLGRNDPSGKPEYIGRVEVSYPSRYKYEEVDFTHRPIPVISLGANGRWAEKYLPMGSSFAAGAAGDFGSKVVNGKKITYGLDMAAAWEGFTLQAEIHRFEARLRDSSDALLQGYPSRLTRNWFRAGGAFLQAAYHIKPIKTIFSVRYEQQNLSDLVPGEFSRVGFAVAFAPKGSKSMIKLQILHNIKDDPQDPMGYRTGIRVGWQAIF
jgi:hypothetical protein